MIIELLLIVFLTLLAAAIGKRILRFFKFDFNTFIEGFVFSVGIGLSAIVFLVWGLGQFGLLYAWFLYLVILVSSVLFFKEIKFFAVGFVLAFKRLFSLEFNLLNLSLFTLLFITVFMTVVGAMAPPTGHDALSYHLAWPKYFTEEHSVFYIPYSRSSLWPYFMEMLFTLGIILKNGIVAKLFHFLMSTLVALAVFSFSRRYFNLQLSIMASTICFLTPGIFTQATYAYVDIASAFFTFLSVYSFFLWFYTDSKRWVVLVGVFCGISMSVKYLGMYTYITLMIGLLVAMFWTKRLKLSEGVKLFLIFTGFTILVAIPWYVKSLIVVGNPVYPFMHELFGGNGWKSEFTPIGIGMGFAKYIFAPWNLTMYPGSYGGEESQIGPVFISMIPVVLVIKKIETPLRYLLFFSMTFFVLWLLGYQAVRFLTPIIPLMSLALVFMYKEITNVESEWFSKFIVLSILLCLGFNACLSIYYNRDKILVAFGVQSKDSYLRHNERSYNVSKFINNNLSADSQILAIEPRTFYIDRPSFRESLVWRVSHYDEENDTVDEIVNWFKNEGFTHILVKEEINKRFDCRGGRNRLTYLLSDDDFKSRFLKLCHKEKFISREGEKGLYSLYKIRL
jgi:hypothetical protein